MFYFFDTSALAKNYISELGSGWVQQVCLNPANTVFISELTLMEMTSLLGRKVREGGLSSLLSNQILQRLMLDSEKYFLIVHLKSELIPIVQNLLNTHSLRTLDAIQLGCCLHVQTLFPSYRPIFVSSDVRLLSIAQQAGFLVDDPNQHP